MEDGAYELVLLMKQEVFVFRMPPMATASRGYKAADWKLDSPDWVGRLRLVAVANRLEVRLEDKTTGALYAKAPIAELGGQDFEPVTDSSRYFVIRLRNDAGQTAFVGIGFADRSDSFDLNVAVQDHFKGVRKEEEIAKQEQDSDGAGGGAGGSDQPKLDLGFKEGQTITVSLGKKSASSSSSAQQPKKTPRAEAGSDAPIPFLPPPPGGPSNRVRRTNQQQP